MFGGAVPRLQKTTRPFRELVEVHGVSPFISARIWHGARFAARPIVGLEFDLGNPGRSFKMTRAEIRQFQQILLSREAFKEFLPTI